MDFMYLYRNRLLKKKIRNIKCFDIWNTSVFDWRKKETYAIITTPVLYKWKRKHLLVIQSLPTETLILPDCN